jgi:hypothetical protein
MGLEPPSESTPATPTASSGSSTTPEGSAPSESSPSADPSPSQNTNILGAAVTFGGAGTAIVFLAQLLLDGEAERIVVSAASILGAIVAYFGRNLGYLFTDPVAAHRRHRKIRAGVKDREVLLKASCDALIARRDAPGVSRQRKAELNAKIAEMEKLFAEDLAEQFRH